MAVIARRAGFVGPMVWGLLALAVVAAAARAQEEPREDEPRLAPAMVFADATAAYRAGAVADEVTVSVRPIGAPAARTGRRERLIVRLATPAPGEAPDRVLLELGPVRIAIADGRAHVTHAGDPSRVFTRALEGPLPGALDGLIPPTPLPQLALAFGGEALSRPTPHTPGVVWQEATIDEAATPPMATVRGRGERGPVSMTVEVRTGRLVRFAAEFEAEGVLLELLCRPIDPGRPEEWLSIAGRREVGSLAELGWEVGRAASAGEPAPELELLRPDDLSRWSLYRAIRDEQGRPRRAAAVVLFRAPGEAGVAAAVMRDARAGVDALRQAVRRLGDADGEGAGEPPATAAAVVVELGDYTRARMSALVASWAEGSGSPPLDADALLWAASAAQTIDRLAPGAQSVLAVVGADGTLRAVIPLDGMAERGAVGLAGEIGAALRGGAG